MPLNSILQYQNKTEPTFVSPEIITEDKWHFAWSEPVRILARTAETTISLVPIPPPPLTWPIYTLVGSLEIKTEMVGY